MAVWNRQSGGKAQKVIDFLVAKYGERLNGKSDKDFLGNV